MLATARVLTEVRERKPLVQCITNIVTVNDCANIILAAGGTPSMASDPREAAEAVESAQALVCNLGAVDHVSSMVSAGRRANALGIPVILDPVGVGGTRLRRDAVNWLLQQVQFTAIRGNATEIRFLAGQQGTKKSGVDAAASDQLLAENLPETVPLLATLSNRTGAVIAMSGPTDIITDGHKTVLLKNGCATMARITGSGCMVTSLLGVFCGATPHKGLLPVCAAAAVMGLAGEKAEKKRLKNGTGNATFRTDLIDAVFTMTEEDLAKGANYALYER